jgi:hypothetical protein
MLRGYYPSYLTSRFSFSDSLATRQTLPISRAIYIRDIGGNTIDGVAIWVTVLVMTKDEIATCSTKPALGKQ